MKCMPHQHQRGMTNTGFGPSCGHGLCVRGNHNSCMQLVNAIVQPRCFHVLLSCEVCSVVSAVSTRQSDNDTQ